MSEKINADADDAAQYFPPGTKVEVSNEDEGFRGSWYLATVLTPPTPPPPQPLTIRSARIAKPDDVRIRKVTIEFTDLLEDEVSKKPLVETLKLVQIRPVPPRERRVVFKLNDKVDALYNDGWWEGVIVKVLEDERFDVFFKASKELIEFGGENLRIHREWVYGEWIPPLLDNELDDSADEKPPRAPRPPIIKKSSKGIASHESPSLEEDAANNEPPLALSPPIIKKSSKTNDSKETPSKASSGLKRAPKSSNVIGNPSNATSHEKSSKVVSAGEKQAVKENFDKGTAIEVKSDEDGFQGAWFSAIILELLSNGRFLIEYKNLKTDDGKEFCREETDILHIRPAPPVIVKVDAYSVYEEVDALYNDGWWVGVISKVYSGSKYMVFFQGTNEKLKFDHSDLRVHQEWIDGKWIVPYEALKL